MLGFVIVNTSIVGTASWAICQALPPLRSEPLSVVVFPMIAIAFCGSAILHRVVLPMQSSAKRAGALYLGFLISLVVYGVYLSLFEGSGSVEQWNNLHQHWSDYVSLIPLSLIMGHFVGGPVLLLLGLVNKVLSPVLTPRTGSRSPED